MPLSSLLLVLGRVITKPAMTCGHLASYCSPLRYGLVWRMLQVDAKEGPHCVALTKSYCYRVGPCSAGRFPASQQCFSLTLIQHQPAATSQPTIFFSHNELAQATRHRPAEPGVGFIPFRGLW
jgi:hypothetical protein